METKRGRIHFLWKSLSGSGVLRLLPTPTRALKSLLHIKGANCFLKGAGWSGTQEHGKCDVLISLGLNDAGVLECKPVD